MVFVGRGRKHDGRSSRRDHAAAEALAHQLQLTRVLNRLQTTRQPEPACGRQVERESARGKREDHQEAGYLVPW